MYPKTRRGKVGKLRSTDDGRLSPGTVRVRTTVLVDADALTRIGKIKNHRVVYPATGYPKAVH